MQTPYMANPNPPNQWKPGESGNPNGRPPKGTSLTELMDEYLDGPASGEGGKIKREEFIERVYEIALKKGDRAMIKLIWNYLDGKPSEKIDITSKGEKLNLEYIDHND